MSNKVADLIAQFLKKKQIRYVFGIVGAGDAQIFDAITQLNYTEIVCVHHEQAAVMAAATYYRVSGCLTAAIVTTGAGSTNTITGVLSAWMDSTPVLIIAGNENSKFTHAENTLRIWGVQGYDSVAMVEKITKYSHRVMSPEQVIPELNKACNIALADRHGPCWIEVPMNLQSSFIEHNFDTEEQYKPVTPHTSDNDQQFKDYITDKTVAVDKIVEQLHNAERPLIWLGQGIRSAGAETLVKELVEKLQCPVLVSWSGIDLIDSTHPLVYGRAGVYGQRAANFILQNCDFLLAIGTRLALPQVGYDITEFARAAKIAVVDNDAKELAKYPTRFNYPIHIDAKEFIQQMLTVDEKQYSFNKPEWLAQCQSYREKYPWVDQMHDDQDGYINSYRFIEKLNQYLKPDEIIVTDMGTALLSGHQTLSISGNQRLITSQGLGEMGFGICAAIGASFARNKGEVLCLNCDGGMMMNLQELQTIVHHNLPIKIIIFNNDGYLMIKHTQNALFKGRKSGVDVKTGVSCPDYSKLASAMGMASYKIRTWDDFDSFIPKMQAEQGPVICEVFMAPDQLFVPKLSVVTQEDGSLISPPLEDLSPLLSRKELSESMLIPLHPKSEKIET